jgi:hypothetical protein
LLVLRHYHLDKTNPDTWVEEEDLPSWVHDDDINTDHGGRNTPRDRRTNSIDEDFALSEQTDMLGLVKGNILLGKNVRGDSKIFVAQIPFFTSGLFCTLCSQTLTIYPPHFTYWFL